MDTSAASAGDVRGDAGRPGRDVGRQGVAVGVVAGVLLAVRDRRVAEQPGDALDQLG
jgi:hypothetical protein